MDSKAETTSKSATTEAGSGVGSRRTVSDTERDQTTTRIDQLTDTGADEAHTAGILDQTRSWNANVKRTYDTLEEELHSSVKAAQDHLNELRTVRLQMLTNMTVNCDALQKQHTAHRDIATDRTWNVDEVSALTAKSGAQADAMVALLAKAIAEALNKA
jgi:hypothetical protein